MKIKFTNNMENLCEDVIYLIYRELYTISVIEEMKQNQKKIMIIEIMRSYPFEKTATYVSKESNIELENVLNVLNNEKKIIRKYNMLYNINTYIHHNYINYLT